MNKFLSSSITFFLSCAIFRGCLDFSYLYFVSPLFSYLGFHYDFSAPVYFSTWAIFIIAVMATPNLLYKVSDYFLTSFLLTIIAPLTSLVGLSGNGFYPLVVTVFVFLFFRIFQHGTVLSVLLVVPKIPKLRQGRFISLIIASISVCVLVGWYFYSGAVRYFNLNLLKVYEFRELSAEAAGGGFFSYFNGWVYSVFSIFLMSYCLLKRRFLILSGLFLVQVFFFGVSAHKSVLFYPLLIVSIWFYFSRTRALSIIPIGFSFIVISCMAIYAVFNDMISGSFLVRRVFFVPAKLALDYFQFFSNSSFVWWSNSFLEGALHYPYEETVPKVIGEFNGSDSSSNNGFISFGYAHAGIFGVAIYSFIFIYFLKVLDVITVRSDLPAWLALCMTIVPLRSALISSDLLTSMLTHGLAVSLIMAILFRRSENNSIFGK